ncbi:hypothetical protein EAI30_10240 [Romboutsia ilealis]|uniref:HNH endonuclease n=1 Tax=Romboutsia faecis TaxID=2764597 RepID=A0ABR7JNQ8_9FIRM|nr:MULTISPECIES: HNH endonuclease [Romboutsia]MBC5996368.1 HNH endonuclease [Romboutsia faecis]MRN24996.1 hypothetical protein [Romboutsia ilealis]SCI09756.1 HNH endonuclease [uncultured Clostridium sp.]
MITKLCARCKVTIQYPQTYCDRCKEIVDKDKEEAKVKYSKAANSRYNKKRDPKYVRFYNSMEWKILSKKYLQDKKYKCEDCGAIASEVHHIKAIQTEEGWLLRLDYNNLRCQCLECHNKKHNRFKRRKK